MKRKSFDKIVTAVGFGLAVFLLIAAGLLNWGAGFASDAVSAQLKAQEITFPAVTGNADESADITTFFAANGEKILSNAAQAQMYADHYLGFHLSKMPTYAAASGASRAAAAAVVANPTLCACAEVASNAPTNLLAGTGQTFQDKQGIESPAAFKKYSPNGCKKPLVKTLDLLERVLINGSPIVELRKLVLERVLST